MRSPLPRIVPVKYTELEPAPSEKAKRDRQRRADLKVRNVQAKERLFGLIYIFLLIFTLVFGVIIGWITRGLV